MRIYFLKAVPVVLALAACSAQMPVKQASSDKGDDLSTNLLYVHDMFCSETADANRKLTELKATVKAYPVMDKATGRIDTAWIFIEPKVQQRGNETLVQWGFFVRQEGQSCGVGYLKPEGAAAIRRGERP